MTVKAIVPIKLRSKRLPKKNILKINGKSLVEWAVRALNGVEGIDEVIVYCSYPSIIEKYIESPCNIVKRCTCLDEDDANFHSIMKWITEKDDIHADYWVWHHATAPFIKSETIQDILDKVTTKELHYDSGFSAFKLQKYVWYMPNQPPWLNFYPKEIGFTQTVEPIYVETSGPWVFPESLFETRKRRVGRTPYIKVVPFSEGIDIDTKEEFELAKAIAKSTYFFGEKKH
jgi:CMP-N-acetylneuraminic acid synthetase